MICTNCGNQNKRGAANCAFCGSPMLPTGAAAASGFHNSDYCLQHAVQHPSKEYQPLSPWAYFGYQLLFSIPLVGFILLIVFSCGGTSNINLRNYARSFWCGLLVTLILATLAFVLILLFIGIPELS